MMKRTWYVLRVKPNAEKKMVKYLAAYGYFRHLPVYTKITRVQRRKVRYEIPLFPGYVFTRLLPEERLRVLQTNLVIATLTVPRPREMIHQLRQIAHAGRAAPDFRPANPYKAGDYVRVTAGPLRGTEGYVKREGANASICLNVEILGAAVEVSISPADVEKVER